ncbi:MAG TPA: hypothetical protein VJZ00_07675 [Thermoanaerobaculia bacterium]|nr:hypothetical protein [Thermoanaerobaculia bacterium]
MSSRVASALLLTLVLAAGASAQSLVVVSADAGAPVMRVHPETGATRTIAFAGAPEPLQVGTLDPSSRRVFFVRDATLTAFDLDRHTQQRIPYPYAAGLPWLVWDESSQRLLSVADWPIRVISIDPHSGDSTTLLTLDTNDSGILWGKQAFDPAGRRLFFMIGNNIPERLAVVDLTTRQYQTVVLTGTGHWFLRYDPTSARILTYGNSKSCKPEIRAIDPANGQEEVLAPVPPGLDATINTSAYDEQARRLFYVTFADAGLRIVTFDVETRTFSSVPFPSRTGNLPVFEFLQRAKIARETRPRD